MEKFELQQLRDLPIEGVAERLGMEVRRHKALCPFHDDHHASLSFNVRKNTYRCFVCGEHGGTIDLVMKVLGKEFREACEWLGEGSIETMGRMGEIGRMGICSVHSSKPTFDAQRYAPFFERPWLSPEARKFLFEERKLDPRVVAWCRLTSWRDRQGVNWLQIPYYDREGRLVGIQNRNLDWFKVSFADVASARQSEQVPSALALRNVQEVQGSKFEIQNSKFEAQPRFRFPRGSRCGIYNLPVLNRLRKGEALYITEGASDCWAMLSSGHKAIAIPSATLLSRKDKELLETWNLKLGTEFHMFPDRDAPGERLFLELQKVLPNLQHHQLPMGCKDYGEYYVKFIVNS